MDPKPDPFMPLVIHDILKMSNLFAGPLVYHAHASTELMENPGVVR
ncbi:MAG: hypothetical protein R3C53_13350 [Pirellulaceae bacterium]